MAYVSRLLEHIPATVKGVSIYSDGPSSEFKNCYIAVSLHVLEENHRICGTFSQLHMERVLSNVMCGQL